MPTDIFGYDTASQVISDLRLETTIGNAENLWTTYLGIKEQVATTN
jgi:hypothetical protein